MFDVTLNRLTQRELRPAAPIIATVLLAGAYLGQHAAQREDLTINAHRLVAPCYGWQAIKRRFVSLFEAAPGERGVRTA